MEGARPKVWNTAWRGSGLLVGEGKEPGGRAAGNRTHAGNVTATYSARNQLFSQGSTTYSYSARGTLASKATGTTATGFE